jgi:hypothetical protein
VYFHIAIACFSGGFAGALLAFQVNPLLWWIGTVAGALVGYLTYELPAVASVAQRAWRAVVSWRLPTLHLSAASLRLYGLMWLARFIATLNAPLVMIGVCLPYVYLIPSSYRPGLLILFLVLLWLIVIIEVPLLLAWDDYRKAVRAPVIDPLAREYAWWLIKYRNPATICLYYMPLATIRTLRQTPAHLLAGYALIRHFGVHLFREIHSDMRTICALDAAVGVAIGYYAGNASIGGIAGAALGIISYEIVSRRLLRIDPRS